MSPRQRVRVLLLDRRRQGQLRGRCGPVQPPPRVSPGASSSSRSSPHGGAPAGRAGPRRAARQADVQRQVRRRGRARLHRPPSTFGWRPSLLIARRLQFPPRGLSSFHARLAWRRAHAIDGYIQEEEEKVLGVVWKRGGSLLSFVLLLWPWWVSVSPVLELLSPLFLSLVKKMTVRGNQG